jgi:hypothetical protein
MTISRHCELHTGLRPILLDETVERAIMALRRH